MEVRVSRASSVIVHRVTPGGGERFLEWQRGISAAATEFLGYQATDVYPPAPGQSEWVVLVHFDHPGALQRWLESPLRAEWLTKLQGAEARFQMKNLPDGFGAWFTSSRGPSENTLPPPWKMVLSVLLGLYPMVMLLTLFVSPHTKRLGLATDMLIGNALSVSLLQWVVMPVLRIVLGPWLRANGSRGKVVTILGLVLVLLALAGLMLFFRAVAE